MVLLRKRWLCRGDGFDLFGAALKFWRAAKNICYEKLWAIFEDELNKQFNEIGEIAY